jgi:hypothetical protein
LLLCRDIMFTIVCLVEEHHTMTRRQQRGDQATVEVLQGSYKSDVICNRTSTERRSWVLNSLRAFFKTHLVEEYHAVTRSQQWGDQATVQVGPGSRK